MPRRNVQADEDGSHRQKLTSKLLIWNDGKVYMLATITKNTNSSQGTRSMTHEAYILLGSMFSRHRRSGLEAVLRRFKLIAIGWIKQHVFSRYTMVLRSLAYFQNAICLDCGPSILRSVRTSVREDIPNSKSV